MFRSIAILEANFLHTFSICSLNDNLLSISTPNKVAQSTLLSCFSFMVTSISLLIYVSHTSFPSDHEYFSLVVI